ncbi:hypothetical protein IR128_05270, partial [Staphylococcus lentus]|nr:hypothetical protein [Mammaliicoccus lentus]
PKGTKLTPGDEISATETDGSGNESPVGKGTVVDTTAPDAPVVNNPETNAPVITGKGEEAGNKVTVTFPDGKTGTGT